MRSCSVHAHAFTGACVFCVVTCTREMEDMLARTPLEAAAKWYIILPFYRLEMIYRSSCATPDAENMRCDTLLVHDAYSAVYCLSCARAHIIPVVYYTIVHTYYVCCNRETVDLLVRVRYVYTIEWYTP